MILIDDLDIQINYMNLSNSVSFSNKLYQTMITILKTPPNNKTHRLTLIMASGNKLLTDQI